MDQSVTFRKLVYTEEFHFSGNFSNSNDHVYTEAKNIFDTDKYQTDYPELKWNKIFQNAISTFLLIKFKLCSKLRYTLVVKNTKKNLRTKEILKFALS